MHKRIAVQRQAYQWYVTNKIVSINVDAIAVENLNVSAMKKRCQPKIDEETGRFFQNGQSRKKGLNRSISDSEALASLRASASWSELVLKIEYLAAKHGKVVIKVNPKHTSQKCQYCGHIDALNRDEEKFICTNCGYIAHADINAAKNIASRAFSIVRGDSSELLRPKHCQETSTRPRGKRVEPGNLCKQDIKALDVLRIPVPLGRGVSQNWKY